MAERKAVIKNADMSEDMQQDAVDCASQALEKYNIEKDIAAFIKKEVSTTNTHAPSCISTSTCRMIHSYQPHLPAPRRFSRSRPVFTTPKHHPLEHPSSTTNPPAHPPTHSTPQFDKKYNPTWHCIVGRNFGSYMTHETKHFIYFYLGQVAVLLFKSG